MLGGLVSACFSLIGLLFLELAAGRAFSFAVLGASLLAASSAAFRGIVNLLIFGGLVWFVLGKIGRRSRWAFVAGMVLVNFPFHLWLVLNASEGWALDAAAVAFALLTVAAMSLTAWTVAHQQRETAATDASPSTS